MVLEHTSLTDFCGIPLSSLRENSISELDLNGKGVGVPGALILSKLLPAATALKSLKYTLASQIHMRAIPHAHKSSAATDDVDHSLPFLHFMAALKAMAWALWAERSLPLH